MSARENVARVMTLGLGVTSDRQQNELLDAYRAEVLREAADAVLDCAMPASATTGQRVGVSRALDVLRRLADTPRP